jgi:hypothetical protein
LATRKESRKSKKKRLQVIMHCLFRENIIYCWFILR